MTKILIADDNPQNWYLLESILKGAGFDVVPAENGAEALDAARKDPPDLIIADILMPVMDGFELCRRWKADERLNGIPLLFYTATYTDPKDERFAMSLGADRFVIKPQKPEILLGIVQDLLRTAREKPAAAPAAGSPWDEREVLRDYNEVLFRKLEKKVADLETEIAERRNAEEKIRLANRKLALMTEVAYQDIQNKVTALRGYVDLSRRSASEEERLSYIEKEVPILEAIHNLISKTKDYQQMGVDRSRWIALEDSLRTQFSGISRKHSVSLEYDLHGLAIWADPLIDRVFYNLLHNAVVHGEKTTRITFSCRETPDGLVIVCEDDGIGIPPEKKTVLFDRIVGGPGTFGLFFVREFLTLYGMAIAETGRPGTGARFEIAIPAGKYRFSRRE